MNRLAIDTTTEILSVSACSDTETTTINSISTGHHSGKLIAAIEKACDLCEFTSADIHQIIVPEGPGSFTGLRIAYATAKAIVLSNNAQLITLPTLSVIASTAKEWYGTVLAVIDAKKGRFYFQAFENGIPIQEAIDASIEEIMLLVPQNKRILVLGPGALLFSQQYLTAIPKADIYTLENTNQGFSHQLIMFAKLHHNEYTKIIPDHAGPFYLRKSDAEIEISRR